MPSTSKTKYVEVLTQMVKNTTPRRKSMLQEQCIVSPKTKKKLSFLETTVSSVSESMKLTNKKRNKTDTDSRRIVALSLAHKRKYSVQQSKMLGISYNLLMKAHRAENIKSKLYCRKKRKDAMPCSILDKVKQFYLRGDVSRDMPDGRSASQKAGQNRARKVMECSLIAAYEKFREEN
jgi:hypothetical protein